MKVDVVMPKMGESIQEGKILQWLKKEGDKIERDEILLEISTDKVDTEVPSPTAGVLAKIVAPEGETVEVGTVIAQIETEATASGSAQPSAPAPAQSSAPAASAAETPAAPPAPAQSSAPAASAAETATAPPALAPAPAPVQSPAPASGGNAIDVVMPKMGESIQEGKILQWLKKEGDKVERDEILLEISTDKVDTEVPSPAAGTLARIVVPEGETVEVGAVIAQITTGASAAPAPTAPKPEVPKQEATQPETAKSAPPAQANGRQTQPSPAIPASNGTHGAAQPVGTTPPQRISGKRFYSPLVRTIAREENVSLEELDSLSGTGMEGRVTKHDITNYLEQRTGKVSVPSPAAPAAPKTAGTETPKPAPAPVAAKPAAPVVTVSQEQLQARFGDNADIVPMDHIRQLIAEHMTRSKQTSAHVTSVGEADVTAIVKLRDKYKDEFQKREGIKLTFTPFFAAATVAGVRAFPNVNVSVEGKYIVKHKRINLSFATALEDGNLIVPVIRNADALNITGLARAVSDLSTRARSKKLSPDDIQGGTVTITNVGTFGTLFGTPVINQPQVAIIGMGAIQKRPVVKEVDGNDLILVRHMAYISITYDHRVVDGALAGQCLAAICKSLEEMNENTVKF